MCVAEASVQTKQMTARKVTARENAEKQYVKDNITNEMTGRPANKYSPGHACTSYSPLEFTPSKLTSHEITHKRTAGHMSRVSLPYPTLPYHTLPTTRHEPAAPLPVLREAQRQAHVRQDVVGDAEDLAQKPAALGQQPRVHLKRKLTCMTVKACKPIYSRPICST